MTRMPKWLFVALSVTWGAPMTILGALVALGLILTGHKPRRHGGCIYFAVGENWGGLELGLFFLTDGNATEHTKNHELGHALQNCLWGVFYPVTIFLWSIARYWYREIRTRSGRKNTTPYDAIWFEGQATRWGTARIERLEG